MPQFFKLFIVFGLVVFAANCSSPKIEQAVSSALIEDIEIVSYPEEIDPNCRNGQAKIFDECTDQVALFEEAHLRALSENKTTLVSYGAEWCIWCHVFDAYINGEIEKFTYTYGDQGSDKRVTHTMRERAKRDVSQEAYNLKKFVSENFVIVHIDYEHTPNGDDVVSITDAWDNYSNFIPYIFTVNKDRKYAASFNHDDAEVRRDSFDWYRGYDRVKLLEQLKTMRSAAFTESIVSE